MLSSTTTLTILPTHLRLIRIPLPLKEQLLHPLLQLWWFRRPGDPFFALCANGVEVSVFAEARAVDKGGWAKLGKSKRGNTATAAEGAEDKGKGKAIDDGVVVSPDVWVALEIAFGGNGWEQAGSRVQSLSSPLAARGVSILFLSTFYADYILVRASSLPLVTSILEEEGFAFAEPVDEREEREVEEFLGGDGHGSDGEDDSSPAGRSGYSTRRSSRDDGVLSSMTASLVLSDEPLPGSRSSSPHHANKSRSHSHSQSRSHSRTSTPDVSRSNSLNLHIQHSHSHSRSPSSTRTASQHTPAAGPSLSLLPDELICVGLSCATPTHTALWRQKVVEALFFPDQLLASTSSSTSTSSTPSPFSAQKGTAPTPFLALTQTPESASLTADVRLLRAAFGTGSGERERDGIGEGVVFAVGAGGVGGWWEGEGEEEGLEGDGGESAEDTDLEAASDAETEDEAESEGEFSFRASDAEDEVGSGRERWEERELHSPIESGEQGADPPSERTLLKCLQLDLVRFGLDKAGVVEHYASLLISAGITSLMYHSTFGSANILVAKRDVRRAMEVVERG
ncbi:hypothetical protein JCM11251_006894 [Rhodosporidiobolus azoricus]